MADIRIGRRNRARELELLAFVRDYQEREGCAPVFEEVALALGVSTPRIHVLVTRLEDAGELVASWVSGRRSPRSLRVVASVTTGTTTSTTAATSAALTPTTAIDRGEGT